MRTIVISDRTYTGFDRRLIPNEAEYIAVALVVGDVEVFHLDGPEAAADVRRYLEYEIEDGSRLIGIYRREPGTLAPVYQSLPRDPEWRCPTCGQPNLALNGNTDTTPIS